MILPCCYVSNFFIGPIFLDSNLLKIIISKTFLNFEISYWRRNTCDFELKCIYVVFRSTPLKEGIKRAYYWIRHLFCISNDKINMRLHQRRDPSASILLAFNQEIEFANFKGERCVLHFLTIHITLIQTAFTQSCTSLLKHCFQYHFIKSMQKAVLTF